MAIAKREMMELGPWEKVKKEIWKQDLLDSVFGQMNVEGETGVRG